ncbi:hypothetical protein LTR01_008934 [Friedmanniomyces endolithicus]|nr:hypothetical protein LTR01_008934 [Friedmanniomyces endolithicus]KAK0823127.1 hypothetical protein LTR73_008748 [Friedmanniomyces endolithicus]
MDASSRFNSEEIARMKSLIKDMDSLWNTSQRLLLPPLSPYPDRGKAANKLFSVTEVLENVLLYLPIPDLHQADDTSRAFRNTVLGSSKLQRKFFRATAKTDPLRSLGFVGPFDLHDPWLGYSISCFSQLEEPFAQTPTYPPLVEFTAFFQSSTGKLPPLREKLLAEHQLCPDAVIFSLNERGFADNTVACRDAFMTKRVRVVDESPFERHIAEDDPARVSHRERTNKSEALRARLIAYTAAKRIGKLNSHG